MSFVLDSDFEVVLIQPKPKLTGPQRAVLRGLELAIRRYGNPSLEEIAACAGQSEYGRYYKSTVHIYLRQLAALGYVELPRRHRPRGVRLLKTEDEG